MTLQERIQLMARLGVYMQGTDAGWENTKARAYRENAWFIPEFINRSVDSICTRFLQAPLLEAWVGSYNLPDTPAKVQTVGLVMAGNIPLVGFHDFLCVFLSGHSVLIKASSKDEVLIRHLVEQLSQWEPSVAERVAFAEQLKGCDAYIATGSNNSGRYFEYYFGKYPHIIRRNRTSVAVLDGSETRTELEALAEDIQLYFGLGCRNITQLYVPEKYDFIPLLTTLKKYEYFLDFHKYKHNYDYHLALLIMGNKYYMNNDSVILTENTSPFSPVSQVHYQYYNDAAAVWDRLKNNNDIQCVVGHGALAFGEAQRPSLGDYADGVDTLRFLTAL
ncbi:Acyl-CoA reductase (LuxC) [Hydrobacter penzbergensis]|uniref:Acyl-CoA reductase (LuxC) n=1 Tax=Hydrobacter penzbergensis TaxID=1235997 RepID=A0A8X8I8K5_9BACT|nr:acyl-CoA reductase [Hydrobacter penzbergensis]SDW10548.1 Acyl-CoA reductase (LuxC) [Hydrobacter penzbergensis]